MLGRILEKFTEERQRRMIFWEVPRRAAEMAANTPKKFTWMPGKTLLKSPKNLKRSGVFLRSLPALRKSQGRFWEWRRRAIPCRVFFDIVEYSPRAQ